MSLTRIQGTTGTTGATFPTSLATTAFATKPTAGNALLVAVIADGIANAQPLTMTDNAGNHYFLLGRARIQSVDQVDIWGAWSIKGATSHVITAGNLGNTTSSIIAEEWSGLPSLKSLDISISASDNTGTSTAVNSGTSGTTDWPNEMLWSATVASSATATATAGSGYSNLTTKVSSPSTLYVQSQVVAAQGTLSGALTLSTGASWITILVSVADSTGAQSINRLNNSGLRPHPFSPGLAR